MHFALEQGTTPKHVDGRLLTVYDEELRPYDEAELRELHDRVTDPNIRIFADADWIYAFNAERFVKGTDINAIFDQLGVDEPTHAFYLGKELMKASIARGPGEELPPGVAARLGLSHVRRAAPRARAADRPPRAQVIHRGASVKKILIQLDTDPRPSAFDAMVAHDAGVDALLSYGDVTPDVVQGLVQGAFFTRAPDDLANLAVWVGGSSMPAGEEVLERGPGVVLRPVQGVGHARLERRQHHGGGDGRADRRRGRASTASAP